MKWIILLRNKATWAKNDMTLKWKPKKTPAILLAFFKFVQFRLEDVALALWFFSGGN